MNAYLAGQFVQSKLRHLYYSILHSENYETGINSIRELFNVRIVSIRNKYILSSNFIIFYMVESDLGILFLKIIPCAMVLKFKESNFPVAFQRDRLNEVSLVFSHCILRIIIHRAIARKSHVKVCHVWLFCSRKCSITSDLLCWNGTCSPVLNFISISTVSNFFIRNGIYVHRVVISLLENFTLFRIYITLSAFQTPLTFKVTSVASTITRLYEI